MQIFAKKKLHNRTDHIKRVDANIFFEFIKYGINNEVLDNDLNSLQWWCNMNGAGERWTSVSSKYDT